MKVEAIRDLSLRSASITSPETLGGRHHWTLWAGNPRQPMFVQDTAPIWVREPSKQRWTRTSLLSPRLEDQSSLPWN